MISTPPLEEDDDDFLDVTVSRSDPVDGLCSVEIDSDSDGEEVDGNGNGYKWWFWNCLRKFVGIMRERD
jgi:hypothetical protein